MAALTIRSARPQDGPELLSMIRELAEFERLADEAIATEEDIQRELFGANRSADAILAFGQEGQAVGFALFFPHFRPS